MPTPLQVLANRRNAQKSTGPRTPRGKAIVRTNAVIHGIHASLPVLAPGERRSRWDKFAAAILFDLQPVGAMETLCAGRIAQLQWRLLRCNQARQNLADQRWREAVATAPQTAWWGFRHEKQQALPATLQDARNALRDNRSTQCLVADVIAFHELPPDQPPPDWDHLHTPILDARIVVKLIEWTANRLNVHDRLADSYEHGPYPGTNGLCEPTPERISWNVACVRLALLELAEWADVKPGDLLATLLSALKAVQRQIRSTIRRAERELHRYRRDAGLQTDHQTQHVDRYEADLERRLQSALGQLRLLQNQRVAGEDSNGVEASENR